MSSVHVCTVSVFDWIGCACTELSVCTCNDVGTGTEVAT